MRIRGILFVWMVVSAALVLTTTACESAPGEGDGGTEEPEIDNPDDPTRPDDPNDPIDDPVDEPEIKPTKELWEPCAEDRECLSDLCLPGPDGASVCSDFCEGGDCPDGWRCMPLGFANAKDGGTHACKVGVVSHCSPCTSDQACGGILDRCQKMGEDGGTYCIAHCKDIGRRARTCSVHT